MKHNVFGLMLATSVALSTLAGCNMPMNAKLPTGSGTGMTQPSSGMTTGKTGGSTVGGSLTTGTNVKVVPTLAPAKQAAAVETTTATTAALQDAAELDAYDTMATQEDSAPAMYALISLNETATATTTTSAEADDKDATATADATGTVAVKPTVKPVMRPGDAHKPLGPLFKGKLKDEVKKKLEQRQAQFNEKQKKQLDKMANDRDKMRGKIKNVKWVDNGDGTETKSFDFSVDKTVNGKTFARSVKMTRTRNKDSKDMLAVHAEFSQTEPSGLTRTSMRDKTWAEDGSAHATFHSEITLPNGTKRVADWDKTISVDGTVSGKGTITWTDKTGKVVKTVNVTLNGTDDATEAKATDDATKTETSVTASVDGTVTAEAKDDEKGEATKVETGDDDDAATGTGTATTGTTTTGTTTIAVGEPAPTGTTSTTTTTTAGTSDSGATATVDATAAATTTP